MPFPQRIEKQEHIQKFTRFFETFMDLHINIPLFEVIAQMPKYIKVLKDLISSVCVQFDVLSKAFYFIV